MSALTDIETKRTVGSKTTPQSQKATKGQKKNNAGGFSFKISPLEQFQRFLILGTEGGTYYASQKSHTLQAVKSMEKVFKEDGIRAVDTIVSISQGGRAPKNDQALFALAYGASVDNDVVRAYALSKLPLVARTGTHLFQFAGYVEKFRGWGRGLRKAVAGWYTEKDLDKLAYQVTKYVQRDGWSHRDLFRLSHPNFGSEGSIDLVNFVTHPDEFELTADTPDSIEGFIKLRGAKSVKDVVGVIGAYNVSHDMIPTEFKSDPKVWNALLEKGMPLNALVRNLGTMTANGTLKPLGDSVDIVVDKLGNELAIRNSRIHPINLLFALKTYQSGQGFRGKNSWSPISAINEALDGAFYLAFDNVEPAGKKTLIALDVSGSMDWYSIAGTNITPRDAAAAMSMVTVRTEPKTLVTAFSTNLTTLDINKTDSLSSAIGKTSRLRFGGTDCAQPMIYAKNNNLEVDTFIVYTDNETWAGRIHPHEALEQYRQHSGRDAKLVVVGMTATKFSIANPKDSGMLDVVGFDTAAPDIISGFSRGDF